MQVCSEEIVNSQQLILVESEVEYAMMFNDLQTNWNSPNLVPNSTQLNIIKTDVSREFSTNMKSY